MRSTEKRVTRSMKRTTALSPFASFLKQAKDQKPTASPGNSFEKFVKKTQEQKRSQSQSTSSSRKKKNKKRVEKTQKHRGEKSGDSFEAFLDQAKKQTPAKARTDRSFGSFTRQAEKQHKDRLQYGSPKVERSQSPSCPAEHVRVKSFCRRTRRAR